MKNQKQPNVRKGNSMEHDYSIEKLVTTFAEHAEMFRQHNEQVCKAYKEQYPDQEIPAHLVNPFCMAHAFSVMAGEIEKLKSRCN